MSHLRAFKLTEKELRPGCREIQVEGELDLAVAEQLEDALERACTAEGKVLVGLEKCDFIDSTGIATIVRAHRRVASQGGSVVVCSPSDQVLRILSITGLTDNGLVFGSAEEALEQIGTA
jgi:anti-sigma B factor antagonist